MALLRDSWLDPDPILYHYMVKLVGSDALGSPGVLYVRGPYYDVLRFYTVDDSRGLLALGVPNTSPSPGYAQAVQLQTRRQANDLVAVVDAIIRDSVGDVAAAQLHVRQIQQLNERIVVVLGAIVGKNLGTDRESARKWWTDQRGYAYQAKPPVERQDWTLGEDKPTYTDSVHSSCFAADTPVLTLAGPMPIQAVKIGDQVLSQDPKTGTLRYQAVIEALHNKPAMVLKIRLGNDTIKATGIHRFWKTGQGWIKAQDVKPGDRLRTLGGSAEVTAVDESLVQPVFNLKVMAGQTYFAGGPKLLVHDSGAVEPVLEPFDRGPSGE